jgi:two-component system, OmpR family, sensor histidine kinase MprB
MPLRRRVGMVAGTAVGIAVVLAAIVCYFAVRDTLRGQVDDALRAQATVIDERAVLGQTLPVIPANAGGPAPYMQLVLPDGARYLAAGDLTLPLGAGPEIAAGETGTSMTDIHVGSSHLRELTFQVPRLTLRGQPVAVQIARPLSSVDNVLSTLRVILLLVILGGVALAVALGRLAAKRVLKPLSEVAETALHISETEDLTARIQVRADDEVGQLALRFNAMLERLEASRAALDASARAQRQLIADASHELRTPVTSLRTNIEVLLEHDDLGDEDRRRMLSDVVDQTEELTGLVGDLIELARGDLPLDSVEDVRLDRVVEDSVERAQRNFPRVRFTAALEPTLIDGVPERLGRAVNNLLDNAARHSPPGGVVEITVGTEGIVVRDHGPGIDDADLPYVFDRFYRGASSRGQQGSGLGLAIVRQVAEQHGGSVSAANAPDRGAVFTLRLPATLASGPGWPGDSGLARAPEPAAQKSE